MKKHRILIISYLFPPAGGIAVQRALSLAKYLPECGFDVHVLSARNAAGPVRDPDLLRQVPAGVTLHSAFTPEIPFGLRQWLWKRLSGGGKARPAKAATAGRRTFSVKRMVAEVVKRVLCPEPEVLWVPFALRQARRIVKKYGIKTVLVTAPPFSAFLVGNALKEQFPDLKLVNDFRDDWLRFYLGEFDYQKSDHTRRRAIEIERHIVELSDGVVVTESMLEHIRARYPDHDSQKFALIPNGYDPATFSVFQVRPHCKQKVIVSHVGTVYSASSPRYYLDALDAMTADVRSTIETRFIGGVADEEKPFLAFRRSAVPALGFIPQDAAVRQMEEADNLLPIMTDAASLTGKLFEYLATGIPILAIVQTDGVVASILHETGAGWYAAPDDPAGIRSLLQQVYQRARKPQSCFKPNWEAIRRFERPRLAAEYGKLLAST